jgi:hypothetical protein
VLRRFAFNLITPAEQPMNFDQGGAHLRAEVAVVLYCEQRFSSEKKEFIGQGAFSPCCERTPA